MRKRRKKRPPSLTGLRATRSQIKGIMRSLHHAHAKSTDPAEKQRISLAALDVEKRINRLTRAVATVQTLQQRKRGYESRIEGIDQRIQRTVGRAFRAGDRWLHKWLKL